MEKKGIVLPELSCRAAAELPPPDFSAPGGPLPEQPESFGGSSAPGVYRSCRTVSGRTASTAARLQLKLRRQTGSSGGAGNSASQLPEYNPFLFHLFRRGSWT